MRKGQISVTKRAEVAPQGESEPGNDLPMICLTVMVNCMSANEAPESRPPVRQHMVRVEPPATRLKEYAYVFSQSKREANVRRKYNVHQIVLDTSQDYQT